MCYNLFNRIKAHFYILKGYLHYSKTFSELRLGAYFTQSVGGARFTNKLLYFFSKPCPPTLCVKYAPDLD